MLKIFGNPVSTCTRKVLMTAAETDTPYELVVLDFAKGDHKSPINLKRQPFGRMPSIDDDGFGLYESRAICRYINEKASGKLIPSDIKGRGKMEQWISVEMSEFTGAAMKFVYQYIFGRPQEPAVLEEAGKHLAASCTVMEEQLARTPFLAGPDFSLADITFMPYVEYAMATPAKAILAKFPHTMTWWNKISERPTWRKVTAKA